MEVEQKMKNKREVMALKLGLFASTQQSVSEHSSSKKGGKKSIKSRKIYTWRRTADRKEIFFFSFWSKVISVKGEEAHNNCVECL